MRKVCCRNLFSWVLLFLFAGTTSAQTSDLMSSCLHFKEDVALKQAPIGTARGNKNLLVVKLAGGKKEFKNTNVLIKPADKNEKPYLSEEESTYWEYCGYISALKAHHVRSRKYLSSNSKLINYSSGKAMPAGEEIYLSPDKKHYVAFAQADGSETISLQVADAGGMLLWQGENFFPDKGNPKLIYAHISEIKWNESSVLEGVAECTDSMKKQYVSLNFYENKWQWGPLIKCQ